MSSSLKAVRQQEYNPRSPETLGFDYEATPAAQIASSASCRIQDSHMSPNLKIQQYGHGIERVFLSEHLFHNVEAKGLI